MVAGEQYLRLTVQFASIAAVSRLLTPTEIGISVLGLGIVAIGLGVREFASADFLVQRREVLDDDVRTAFTVGLLLSALIAATVFALAPVFGALYGAEDLARFLRVAAFSFVVEAVALPIRGLLRREMAFGTLAFINTSSAVVLAATTILLALAGFSYMSFAWATVAAAVATAGLSLLYRPALPKFHPTLRCWRHVLAFGGHNGAVHVITRACEKLPELVLGGILPAAAVGSYNRAVQVSTTPRLGFLAIVFAVAFPALAAEIRQGRSLREPYLRSLGYVTVLYWPALVLLAILAQPVVLILLGDQWLSVVPLVQVMTIGYLALFPNPITMPLLLAVGANRDRTLVHLIARPVSAAILCGAAYFGVMAMAISHLLTLPYMMLVTLWFARRHIEFGVRDLTLAVWKSAVVTVGSALGPLAVVALAGTGFDLSLGFTALALILAGAGWLSGVVLVQHPVLFELERLAEVCTGTPFARPVLALRELLIPARSRAGEAD